MNNHTAGIEPIFPQRNIPPVLIAGAGPVGCLAALYLAQHGIPVILFEGKEELPIDLRASTFHPPTLDLLDKVGLTERLIPQGLIVREFQFRERKTGDVARFNMARLTGETRHPYRLQCEQFKMTRTAVEMLAQYPHAEVRYSAGVVGYREDGEGVEALIFDGDHEDRVRGSFLIGADGASSRIRQASGTKFEGLTYPERFLVVSTNFPFEHHFNNLSWVNYVSDPDEWCVMLKTPKLWRIQVPTPIDANPEDLLSDAFIESRLQRLHAKDSPYQIAHRTLYKVHQRVAETYRVGRRVLLAGDSAHVNNPLGGMGMNGGVQDAYNLCEKIVDIVHGRANMDQALDLYDLQRRTVCVDFIQNRTKENKAMMETKDTSLQAARQRKFMEIVGDPEREKQYLMESSMIKSWRTSYAIAA
ncbi:MAG: FAD-dependent monooxygenase [Pseudomonadota bacterium]